MTSLKDHQAAMVDLLANGSALSSSGSRLAHALHDVLSYLNDTNAAPVAHTERRIDATTPGLNDALLAADVQAVKPKQQSLESLLKQRDNTIRQLKARVADLVRERDHYKQMLGADPAYFEAPERGLPGKGDNPCEHSWRDTGRELYCKHCGVHPSDLPEQAGCRKEDTQLPDDGWIDWSGGKRPVDSTELIEIMFRNGESHFSPAKHHYEWRHFDRWSDIIAYRIVGASK